MGLCYSMMASLVISSYDDFEYARSSIQLDAVDYVLKPIEEKALGLALERALNKVDQTRNFSATARMGRHLAECGELIQKWVDQVHTHSVAEEALFQETVEKLVLISQDQVLLLPALAAAWLLHVAGELRLQDYAACAANATQTHHVDGLLRRDDLRTEMSQTCHKTLQSGYKLIQRTYDDQWGNPQHHLVRKALSCIAQHYARSNLFIGVFHLYETRVILRDDIEIYSSKNLRSVNLNLDRYFRQYEQIFFSIDVDMNPVTEILGEMKYTDSGEGMLLDETGRIMAHSDLDGMAKPFPMPEHLEPILLHESGYIHDATTDKIIAYSTLEQNGWKSVSVVPLMPCPPGRPGSAP